MEDFMKDKTLKTMYLKSTKSFEELRNHAKESSEMHMKREAVLTGLPTDEDKRQFEKLNSEIKRLESELQAQNEEIKLFHYKKEEQDEIEIFKKRQGHLLANENKPGQQEMLMYILDVMRHKVIEKSKTSIQALLTVPSTAAVIDLPDQSETKEQYKVYGLLLSACKIKDVPLDIERGVVLSQVNMKLLQTDMNKFQIGYYLKIKEKSLKLAWDMLKLLPPIVVCQPMQYHEDIHDTNRATWDEENVDGELTYYRPVLVYGNHLHIAVKGLVGNNLDFNKKTFSLIDRVTQTELIAVEDNIADDDDGTFKEVPNDGPSSNSPEEGLSSNDKNSNTEEPQSFEESLKDSQNQSTGHAQEVPPEDSVDDFVHLDKDYSLNEAAPESEKPLPQDPDDVPRGKTLESNNSTQEVQVPPHDLDPQSGESPAIPKGSQLTPAHSSKTTGKPKSGISTKSETMKTDGSTEKRDPNNSSTANKKSLWKK